MPLRGARLAVAIIVGGLLLLGLLLALLAKPDIDRRIPEAGGPSGRFDYYVLVLRWSPTYCAHEGTSRHDAQCNGGHRRAFVLHGLWPQNNNGWPQDCADGTRIWVPQPVIDDMRDIMPSKNLVIHEYRTHGTCSGLEPREFFGLARNLYDRVAIPPRFAAATDRSALSPGEIEEQFLGANPWLRPDMISVTCRGQELLDIRVCFGRDRLPRACGPNEDRSACHAGRVAVPTANDR
jgi:ribonuclease T2